VFRLVLPAFSALLILTALDADASIRRELDELMGLVEAGQVDVADVTMTTRLVQYAVTIPVHGAKERKQVRYARLRLLLDGDRLHVYRREGWPTARHLEDYAGSVTELWTYDDRHITYIFKDGQLIETRRD
jgi:hypothetical protein